MLLEARDVLGGKVCYINSATFLASWSCSFIAEMGPIRSISTWFAQVAAWRDEDGDVYETGLHIFFGWGFLLTSTGCLIS